MGDDIKYTIVEDLGKTSVYREHKVKKCDGEGAVSLARVYEKGSSYAQNVLLW